MYRPSRPARTAVVRIIVPYTSTRCPASQAQPSPGHGSAWPAFPMRPGPRGPSSAQSRHSRRFPPPVSGRKWERMRLKFLMANKPILYNQLILNGTPQSHLVEINETACRRLEQMILVHDSFPLESSLRRRYHSDEHGAVALRKKCSSLFCIAGQAA